jgi:chromosome segregation ATPase
MMLMTSFRLLRTRVRPLPIRSGLSTRATCLNQDMATAKAQLDHLKESIDTNFQTNLETRQISDLDTKLSVLDSKISALESEMNSKFDTLKTDVVRLQGDFEYLLVWQMPASSLSDFLQKRRGD